MFRLLFLLSAFLVAAPALAQWPTTDWVIGEELDKSIVDKSREAAEHIGVGDFGASAGFIAAEVDQWIGVWGDRAVFAVLHEGILEGASLWYQSLGFPAPYQRTSEGDLTVDDADEAYRALLKASPEGNGSAHTSNGQMLLTTNPGFLSANTPAWALMKYSAVHELFHAIQRRLVPAMRDDEDAPKIAGCIEGDTALDWLVEGSAAAVQIRWAEGKLGVPYGHPFKGSDRAAWVRYFDQPLHHGRLPQMSIDRSPDFSIGTRLSWACDYGTWYFWYAVGEMIGRTAAEKVGYLRYIFAQGNPGGDYGYANVDAGLKAAARAYDAIEPYRGGLYDLYPQFVAQFLTDDRFYQHLHEAELATPDLYQTSSEQTGGKLEVLAARAWRFRIPMPQGGNTEPYLVRFTLDVPDGVDRSVLDALHLIVGTEVAPERFDPKAPYVLVRRTDRMKRTEDGFVEFLVRVANVAKDVDDALPAPFTLRVEVGGYYGEAANDVNMNDVASRVAAELPPGFVMQGPGRWSCSGDVNARAIFDLLTPEEAGRDMERAVPQLFQKYGQVMENAAIAFQKMQRQGNGGQLAQQGIDPAAMMEKMAAARNQMRAKVDDLGLDEATAAAAEQARARTMSRLAATFVGVNDGGECQILLHAQLAGRHGGAQILAGAVDRANYPDGNVPKFNMRVLPADVLEARRNARQNAKQFAGVLANSGILGAKQLLQQTLRPMLGKPSRWEVCTMTAKERRDERASASENCPAVLCTPGKLVLENAEQGHITGTFSFEVVRWSEDDRHCRPLGRDEVTGHFNVTSTDDGHDDDSIGGLGIGIIYSGTFARPGMPLLDSGDAE